MDLKIAKAVLLAASLGVAVSGCTQMSRSLGKLTANKYAEPRSGSLWVVPPPQLEPVAQNKKSVYVSFRNISDADIDLTSILKKSATDQGWNLVTDPSKATYRLRASLRFWGEVKPESGGAARAASMGTITGAAVGFGTAAALNNRGGSGLGNAAGGLAAGGLVAMGMSNASRPREWALICDFVLEEYSNTPVSFTMSRSNSSSTVAGGGAASSRMAAGGGTRGGNTSAGQITKKSHYFPHGMRLSVWSNQMNMEEAEALPFVDKRLEKVIKQILPK